MSPSPSTRRTRRSYRPADVPAGTIAVAADDPGCTTPVSVTSFSGRQSPA
jgi:hypothetical protein